ncbi:hypothetical protein [Lysobacter gummosus]|uniref:hypothetical protein n=1 Tax=Lysobacter gummosus TaxID=262324 RepID=UPI003624CECD
MPSFCSGRPRWGALFLWGHRCPGRGGGAGAGGGGLEARGCAPSPRFGRRRVRSVGTALNCPAYDLTRPGHAADPTRQDLGLDRHRDPRPADHSLRLRRHRAVPRAARGQRGGAH